MSEKNSKNSTKPSTASKPSTGSDIDITVDPADAPKNRWLRFTPKRPDLPELGPEIGKVFDLYWGGPERRITGLTLRIISVNVIALIILMVGILYLGQYQNRLIETKLENFENELMLVSDALSEGASTDAGTLSIDKTNNIIARLSLRTRHHIIVFDNDGNTITDSDKIGIPQAQRQKPSRKELESVKTLKNTANFIIKLLPDNQRLPQYPDINSNKAQDYPDAKNAINNALSLSVWRDADETILLSAAAPLQKQEQNLGIVLIKRKGQDIENDLIQVWVDVLKIFLVTLLITTLLSIYLSGVIARPLKRLARAAEAVRKGQSSGANDIPDFSHRFDEIGELSVALKAMTTALWERMDTIENFAADVSHELKNPLTSLKSALETLEKVTKPEDQKKLMDIIRHDLKRMDRLITDISSASRLDAELSREAFKTIDIKILLQRIVQSYQDPLVQTNQANKTNFHFNCEEKAAAFLSKGIENRLGQVFRNIIDNALSFSPQNAALTITLTAQHKNLIVTIQDEGPGIPDNKLTTIFERFYSERPQTEGYGNNSGLGLSICKQIIDAHGGELFAENTRDTNGKITGARFKVILKSA